MRVVVRADAGVELGIGHLVRCSALLDRLTIPPSSVLLITSGVTQAMQKMIDGLGWETQVIGEFAEESSDAEATRRIIRSCGPIDLLVCDHYGLGETWESIIRESVSRLVVVDDLANRRHACDVLIDPTMGQEPALRYRNLVPQDTVLLLGPQYVLLGSQYDQIQYRPRSGHIRSWLVYLGGGTDPHTLKPLLDAFMALENLDVSLTVVLGLAFQGHEQVHSWVTDDSRISVLDWTDDMPKILESSDCAIGALGGAQWERCVAGLPTLTVSTVDNQSHDAVAFEKAGATKHLGDIAQMTSVDWREAFLWAHSHPSEIQTMARAATTVVSDRNTAWSQVIPVIMQVKRDDRDE